MFQSFVLLLTIFTASCKACTVLNNRGNLVDVENTEGITVTIDENGSTVDCTDTRCQSYDISGCDNVNCDESSCYNAKIRNANHVTCMGHGGCYWAKLEDVTSLTCQPDSGNSGACSYIQYVDGSAPLQCIECINSYCGNFPAGRDETEDLLAQIEVNVDVVGGCSDEDGDKVFAAFDQCPDTPEGAPVDGTGCYHDMDWDPTNELQELDFDEESKVLTLSGASTNSAVDLSSLGGQIQQDQYLSLDEDSSILSLSSSSSDATASTIDISSFRSGSILPLHATFRIKRNGATNVLYNGGSTLATSGMLMMEEGKLYNLGVLLESNIPADGNDMVTVWAKVTRASDETIVETSPVELKAGDRTRLMTDLELVVYPLDILEVVVQPIGTLEQRIVGTVSATIKVG